MIHHVSFNARAPERAAAALAELLNARAIRAPAPPFPKSAWFVCLGDDAGTLIEVMPWGETRDASAPRGVGFDEEMRETSGAHILISTERGADHIFAIAARHGWKAEHADAGLFRFIKVWVENGFLIEFLTPEDRAAYVDAFGKAGVDQVDRKLRALEHQIAQALAKA